MDYFLLGYPILPHLLQIFPLSHSTKSSLQISRLQYENQIEASLIFLARSTAEHRLEPPLLQHSMVTGARHGLTDANVGEQR